MAAHCPFLGALPHLSSHGYSRWAHNELLVGMRVFADEVLLNIDAELDLARGLADFAVGVIHKDAEITHAEVIELLQFDAEPVHVGSAVLITPIDGVGRVNGPEKANVVLAGMRHHFFQLCCLVLGIKFIAACAVVVRGIFRGVDISVEFVEAVEKSN